MSPLGQDEHIRRLVEAEIAHSRATIEVQNAPTPPDPMARWSPLLLGGTLGVAVVVMLIAVIVVIVF